MAPETVIDPLLSAPVVVIAPDPTSIDAPVIAPTCRVPSDVVPVTANDPEVETDAAVTAPACRVPSDVVPVTANDPPSDVVPVTANAPEVETDAAVTAPTCRVPSDVSPVTANDPTRVVAPATIKPGVLVPVSVKGPKTVVVPSVDAPETLSVARDSVEVETDAAVTAPTARVPSVAAPATANDPTRVVAPATTKPGVVEPESVSCPKRVVAADTDKPIVDSEASPERAPVPFVTIAESCARTPALEKYGIGFVVDSEDGPVIKLAPLNINVPDVPLTYKYPPLVGDEFVGALAVELM